MRPALHKLITTATCAVLAVIPVGAPAKEDVPSPAPAVFPIADVIAEIKTELAAAESAPGTDIGLPLSKVEVNFSLAQSVDTKGDVSIGIPVVGGIDLGGSGERKAEQTSSLVVDLVPPKGTAAMSGTDFSNFGLTQAIVSTRAQLQKGMAQPPKLTPQKVVITIKFAVSKSSGGTGKIKFLIFSIGGGKTSNLDNASSIELTFAKG